MKTFCVSYDLVKGNSTDQNDIREIFKNLKGSEYLLASVWKFTLSDKWTCESVLRSLLKHLKDYNIKIYAAETIDDASHKI